MRDILLLLLLFALVLGGCAVTVRTLQPTIDSATHTLLTQPQPTDPIDDLIRFRAAEQEGRGSTLLLPVFALFAFALLILALATPLPRILKEWRLLRRQGERETRRQGDQAAWRPGDEERAVPVPPVYPSPLLPPPPPPPHQQSWLED
jgi:hypothetical protein